MIAYIEEQKNYKAQPLMVSDTLYSFRKVTAWLPLLMIVMLFTGCYSFKDASVPASVKTYRLKLIENRATNVNPQLAPQLTDRLRQKINSQFSRLRPTQGEDAHYDIAATIVDFRPVTSGVAANQQAATNRIIVTVKIDFVNNLTEGTKSFEADVSRNFDYGANVDFTTAQQTLLSEIVRNMTDEIFNRIFSNW
ncbi:MAG: LPS assembly lipoprotein LptE [Flavitalea sp.]